MGCIVIHQFRNNPFFVQKEKPPVKARRSGAHYNSRSSSLLSRLSKKGLSKRRDIGVANSFICIYIVSNQSFQKNKKPGLHLNPVEVGFQGAHLAPSSLILYHFDISAFLKYNITS